MLVAGDVAEPLDEGGQRPFLLVEVHDEVLAGEGQHPLDHHVVERHRLDHRLGVLRFLRQPLGPRAEHLVEEPAEVVVQVLGGLTEHVRQPVGLEHADLPIEALEEADVAGLVGDLGAEEDFLVLGRCRPHDRPELLGHLLLADEERRQPVHPLEALFLRDPLMPVDPVLGEVQLLGLPLLPLPEVIQLPVAEQLDVGGPIGRLVQRRVGRRLIVRPLRPRLDPRRLSRLHAALPKFACFVVPGRT